MLINISTISLTNARAPGYCNVVNHDREHHNPEYIQATQATNFSRYIHILKLLDPPTMKSAIWLYHFTEDEIKTLIAAGYVTTLTLRSSKIHAEELAEITDRLQVAMLNEYGKSHSDLFFRLDACSTKDSTYGIDRSSASTEIMNCGPIKTAQDVIKRIISSQRAIYSLENRDSSLIVFKPWRADFKLGQEFRCFFYQGHLTAISQYSPYEYYGWDLKKDALIKLVGAVIQTYKKIFPELSKLAGFENCVMDVYYNCDPSPPTSDPSPPTSDPSSPTSPPTSDPSPLTTPTPNNQLIEVIEFNPFGWKLNSGPACFHWLRDHDILSNEDPETVEVRVVRNTENVSTSQYVVEFDNLLTEIELL